MLRIPVHGFGKSFGESVFSVPTQLSMRFVTVQVLILNLIRCIPRMTGSISGAAETAMICCTISSADIGLIKTEIERLTDICPVNHCFGKC